MSGWATSGVRSSDSARPRSFKIVANSIWEEKSHAYGRLREECLRVSWFENLFGARRKAAVWRREYNEERAHSSLNYRTPAEFAATSYGKDAGYDRLENDAAVSHFPTAPTTAG